MRNIEEPSENSNAPIPSLALEDQLCFALYTASRAITNRYRPLLSELGLTYPQYLVMLALWEQGALPIKNVGAALKLDYGTLTPLLKRLEAQGLIRRERRVDDERSVQVTLTQQGVELRERVRETVPSAIGTATGLSPREVAEARQMLSNLTANVCSAS
ncbi:MarR family winged helix-turn-helix transcriptional regulator [Streptomyces sp. NPDC058434]|uniref:MarR family winged helix-turn-helix transcriptional regulator n=1 Tax=Streptomyces sp. NPDC058434 TaxID=3346498 RepID=UPI00364C44AB